MMSSPLSSDAFEKNPSAASFPSSTMNTHSAVQKKNCTPPPPTSQIPPNNFNDRVSKTSFNDEVESILYPRYTDESISAVGGANSSLLNNNNYLDLNFPTSSSTSASENANTLQQQEKELSTTVPSIDFNHKLKYVNRNEFVQLS